MPLIETGIVNVAPWQAFSEAFDMLAAPVRVVVVWPPAGTATDSDVWSVNVTPVVVQPEWPASGVIVPLPVTLLTVTGKPFGLLIRIRTSPAGPAG